jgi:hypothetical protein
MKTWASSEERRVSSVSSRVVVDDIKSHWDTRFRVVGGHD